jgi:hypothetical protein
MLFMIGQLKLGRMGGADTVATSFVTAGREQSCKSEKTARLIKEMEKKYDASGVEEVGT